ncbi:MAG: phasin family protein [Sphingobium sp.]
MIMAEDRKLPRNRASTTLSAGEILKAAENAINAAPAPKLSSSSTSPTALAAATTAVDAAPEPPVTPAATPAATPDEVFESPVAAIEQDQAQTIPVIEGTTIMNEVFETSRKFADDTKAKIETAYADFNGKARAGVEKSTKALSEISDITKGNVEALVESGKIAAKAAEAIGQEAVDYGRRNFEKATASLRSLSTAKTPTEFFQLHSQFLSSSFDDFAKETAKNSEAMLKLAGEIAQPLTARVTVVTDKVKALAV